MRSGWRAARMLSSISSRLILAGSSARRIPADHTDKNPACAGAQTSVPRYVAQAHRGSLIFRNAYAPVLSRLLFPLTSNCVAMRRRAVFVLTKA